MDPHILFSSQHLWTLMNGLRDIFGLKYSSTRIRNCRIHVNSRPGLERLSSLQSPDSLAARTSWLALTICAFLTFTTSCGYSIRATMPGSKGSFFRIPDLTILRVSFDRKYHHLVVEVEWFSSYDLTVNIWNLTCSIQCNKYICDSALWLVIALCSIYWDVLYLADVGMQTRFLLRIDCVDQSHISTGTEIW